MRRLALACALLVAIALAVGPALARQDDSRLKELFVGLQAATSSLEARVIEAKIWRIWTENGDPRIDALMQRGVHAMSVEDLETALAAFNEVVRRDNGFAEGFNKRATVEFMRRDFDASVVDIERTLALEPHHFGALAGLGQIYMILKKKDAALKAFEAALKINPRLENVEKTVKELKQELQGSPT
jgi:tetratricopeptide (TPR) repeat protein